MTRFRQVTSPASGLLRSLILDSVLFGNRLKSNRLLVNHSHAENIRKFFELIRPQPPPHAQRAHVAAAGWVTLRVALRAPAAAEDLEQTAQDLLFALPTGSYDTVARAAGSASLTVRVDAVRLDALLGSP